MTVQEYLETAESVLPSELAYGVLRVADAPLVNHQRAVARLFRALDEHATNHVLGEMFLSPVDVILDPSRHLVVQPDLLFVSSSRSHIVADRIYGAPDLVVEVLSPAPRIGTLREHVRWFAEYGVEECWVVHLPARCIDVLRFGGSTVAERRRFETLTPLRSKVLPAFSRTPAEILGY